MTPAATAEDELLLWYHDLCETNNDRFIDLFFDRHRYQVLKGGGGSGKSIYAGRKVLERAASEPGHRILVVRKVARTLRESCFEQLRRQAYEHYASEIEYIPKGKAGDMYIRFRNGSEILFAGLDDVEKLKSIFDITSEWIEEASELEEGDFNQLDIRLRADSEWYPQIILTFNPISITHWLKRRFFDQTDERVLIHESTYKDNRFLIPEAIKTLESFKETDPYYYQVYCLGEWGVTGQTVFDGRAVTERLLECRQRPPITRGTCYTTSEPNAITAASWGLVEDGTGPVAIYKRPEDGHPYVIGCDTAGDGSDWFVAQVLDNSTGEQVATMRQQMDEDEFTRQLYALGMYYNTALIGIECNFSSYPTKLLELMRYPRQYVREREDTYSGKTAKAFGFRTTSVTRPVIIGDLVRIMRDGIHLIHDCPTLEEMLSFVRNVEKGRAEAEPGAHDDCVMALAIAYYVRDQQDGKVGQAEPKRVEWTEDMWEDYRNASRAEREYLKQKWGEPKR